MSGRGTIGGFTASTVGLSLIIGLVASAWALFGSSDHEGSFIFAATVSGFLGLFVASAGVRWRIVDEILRVRQFGISRSIPLNAISEYSVMHHATWKQGVGIRFVGYKEWAMLCGARDLVAVRFEDSVFHFSVDDASGLASILDTSATWSGDHLAN